MSIDLALVELIWFKAGTGKEKQLIPILSLASEYGSSICHLLSVIHAMSGYDSVSSFSQIDKKRIPDT